MQRVLVFSYAFPPMRVQMSPVVARAVASLNTSGFLVDVLCGPIVSPFLNSFVKQDESLLSYAKSHTQEIFRLTHPAGIMHTLRSRSHWMMQTPDIMASFNENAFNFLMNTDLEKYSAILTFSPFHSVNAVMVKLKKIKKNVPWISHFCDPLASNPLEKNWISKIWATALQKQVLSLANYITYSSEANRNAVLKKTPHLNAIKMHCIPHFFDKDLYPKRPKMTNDKLTMRFIGTLFGKRTPEYFFIALNNFLKKNTHLINKLQIELVGTVENNMLLTENFLALPEGVVQCMAEVSYLESLEKMYDADILLLIEADVNKNLFVPSKIADYFGSSTPIIVFSSSDNLHEISNQLGCWVSNPSDIEAIEHVLKDAIYAVLDGSSSKRYNYDYRGSFEKLSIEQNFSHLILNMEK